jgi:fibronectin type 3 domain-containing protein
MKNEHNNRELYFYVVLTMIVVFIVAAIASMWKLAIAQEAEKKTVSVTFAWAANTESDLAGYNLYREIEVAGLPQKEKIDIILANKETYVYNAEVVEGEKACYHLTAFDNAGNESGPSNTACTEEFSWPPAAPQDLEMTIGEIVGEILKNIGKLVSKMDLKQ